MKRFLPIIFLTLGLPAGAQTIPPGAQASPIGSMTPVPNISPTNKNGRYRTETSDISDPNSGRLSTPSGYIEKTALVVKFPSCGRVGVSRSEEIAGRIGGVNSLVTGTFLRVTCKDNTGYVLRREMPWHLVNGVYQEEH